jgi:type II secretory pathway pseudopilin PulG
MEVRAVDDERTNSRPADPRAGFTLVQVTMTAAILAIGILGLSAVIAQSVRLTAINQETVRARQASNMMLEEIRSLPFSEVYSMVRASGTESEMSDYMLNGETFEVPTIGLPTVSGGMTGHIEFPTSGSGLDLCESTVDASLGMPMDLNGDGEIDDEGHAADYVLLPVRIRVEWEGIAGARQVEIYTVLRDGGSDD